MSPPPWACVFRGFVIPSSPLTKNVNFFFSLDLKNISLNFFYLPFALQTGVNDTYLGRAAKRLVR